ncbi:MAG: hypothetical protein FRX49_05848 [Trebouxia sp. A1-2]|nr:MAG: hypothetical protein FRX49_05848 [Trebouxia sp. A1-2]
MEVTEALDEPLLTILLRLKSNQNEEMRREHRHESRLETALWLTVYRGSGALCRKRFESSEEWTRYGKTGQFAHTSRSRVRSASCLSSDGTTSESTPMLDTSSSSLPHPWESESMSFSPPALVAFSPPWRGGGPSPSQFMLSTEARVSSPSWLLVRRMGWPAAATAGAEQSGSGCKSAEIRSKP